MVLVRPSRRDAHGGENRKNGGSARRMSTETTHYTVGMPSCEQKITVGNRLAQRWLGRLNMHASAAKQGPGQHGGKQGKCNSAAEVSNVDEGKKGGEVQQGQCERHNM
jgi:hypothetical protein